MTLLLKIVRQIKEVKTDGPLLKDPNPCVHLSSLPLAGRCLLGNSWVQGPLWWSSGQDPAFQSRGRRFYPGSSSKISHVSRPKKKKKKQNETANQNIKEKRCCKKSNKDFKNGPHQKNLWKTVGLKAYNSLFFPNDEKIISYSTH